MTCRTDLILIPTRLPYSCSIDKISRLFLQHNVFPLFIRSVPFWCFPATRTNKTQKKIWLNRKSKNMHRRKVIFWNPSGNIIQLGHEVECAQNVCEFTAFCMVEVVAGYECAWDRSRRSVSNFSVSWINSWINIRFISVVWRLFHLRCYHRGPRHSRLVQVFFRVSSRFHFYSFWGNSASQAARFLACRLSATAFWAINQLLSNI